MCLTNLYTGNKFYPRTLITFYVILLESTLKPFNKIQPNGSNLSENLSLWVKEMIILMAIS